ncbi:FAD-dependent oxidoreductase [Propionibacteriaceae bacterium Y2011]
MDELSTEVLVVGGGLGGVAAAWSLAAAGHKVVLTEESDWLGGQLTSQGVPPDEHPWIEHVGSTHRYRQLRTAIRDWYRTHRNLRATSARLPYLNPGAGLVSPLCHEPAVSAEVMAELLQPYVRSGHLTIMLQQVPVAAATGGDRVEAVTFRGRATGTDTCVSAAIVLDASETGELIALAGVEHVTGFESREETGEEAALDVARPTDMQAASWCFAVEHLAGEDHTIDRPDDYADWRSRQPAYWPGRQFGWTVPHPHTLAPRHHSMTPNPDDHPDRIVADQSADSGADDLWRFRRMLARNHYADGGPVSDVTLVNWPMIDYLDGPVLGGTAAEDAHHAQQAKRMSRAFLYWLQTEAPRSDGGTGFPGLRLRPDVMGTDDGFAKRVYIRESRRIRARYTITANDVAVRERPDGAVAYPDSVGTGAYRIDLHPSTGGENYIDVPAHPFQIPYRALVPVRVRNVLAAGKSIGTTHISNGCYRLHPVEWSIGEAAGIAAAHCLEHGLEPQQLEVGSTQLAQYQQRLRLEGVDIAWPRIQPW